MTESTNTVFTRAAQKLTELGMPAEYYTIPAFPGYKSIMDTPTTDVHTIEAYLGIAHKKPDYEAYAVAQTFHPKYPSMAIVMMVERHKVTKEPIRVPTFNAPLDYKFSALFLPLMYTAFNPLDPTGQEYGQLVQPYNSNMTKDDLLNTPHHINLVRSFKKNHQLANIAVDYGDPLMTIVANILAPVLGSVGDIRWIPRNKQKSLLEIPIRKPGGGYFLLGDNSTALDAGFRVAYEYLDRHYAKFGLKTNADAPVQQGVMETA